MKTNVRKTQILKHLPLVARLTVWLRPIEKRGKDSLWTAVKKYLNYIQAKGELAINRGGIMNLLEKSQRKSGRTKTEEILEMIKQGK